MKYRYRLPYPEGYTEWRMFECRLPIGSDRADIIAEIELADSEVQAFLDEFGWYRRIVVEELGV